MMQRRRNICRFRRKIIYGEIILVRLSPQENGLDLLYWTVKSLARPGDLVVALVVSASLLLEGRSQSSWQSGKCNKKEQQSLWLAELIELSRSRQIRMEVKFCVADCNEEEVVIKQAIAFKATILVLSISEDILSRCSGCTRVFCESLECAVIAVRNGKVFSIQQKFRTTTKSISHIKGMQTVEYRQGGSKDAQKQISQLFRLLSRERKNKLKKWYESKRESSPRGVLEGTVALCNDSDSSSSTEGSPHRVSKQPLLSSSHWEPQNNEKSSRWRGLSRLWKRSASKSSKYLVTLRSRVSSKNLAGNLSWKGDVIENDFTFSMNHLSPDSPSAPLTSGASWKNFTLEELKSATNDFASDNFLGKGGYAEVYKGSFPDEGLLAVKRLTRGRTEEQRVNDFLTELGIIVHVKHPNTARLVGFCVEGGLHFVFQFSPHGSLASMLHGPNADLIDWNVRYKVALGVASGLLYLHEGCKRRIIHRDIKASNILLTEQFEPQISDFGLAKWLPQQWSHLLIAEIEGTFGYLAPEYFMHGIVDEKTDVFAFGVVLLELITGRRPIASAQESLVLWARPLLKLGKFQMLVDPRLGDSYDNHQLKVMALTACWCIQQASIARPSMKEASELMCEESENVENSTAWQFIELHPGESQNLEDLADYVSSTYLTDMSRHREVALDFLV